MTTTADRSAADQTAHDLATYVRAPAVPTGAGMSPGARDALRRLEKALGLDQAAAPAPRGT